MNGEHGFLFVKCDLSGENSLCLCSIKRDGGLLLGDALAEGLLVVGLPMGAVRPKLFRSFDEDIVKPSFLFSIEVGR